MSGQLRILEGATFCICDELGDLNGNVEGLFTEDTRFLSSLRLTINGQRPLLLSSDKIEYFSAAFFMTSLRGSRSATTPATSSVVTCATVQQANAIPVSVAEPVRSSTAKATAIGARYVPK